MEKKVSTLLSDTYNKLSSWQKTQVARHPERPHTLDYAKNWLQDAVYLHGDRTFSEDAAIIGVIGTFKGQTIMLIGHEKGYDLKTRIKHNFGMGRPEGYRKAIRLMKLANRFNIPVITLIDTPGAYPGIGAEERGQAEAIARATQTCLSLNVPLISIIIGEGGSGGAVSLATADYVIMLQNAIYSVISPEGCASILWRDSAKANEASEALKLTSNELLNLKIIDEIVAEPLGGAHRGREITMNNVAKAVKTALDKLKKQDNLKQKRREKFVKMT
jgi:acetyl-CoA carboxylase carboxyl transferase subunit alpha